MAKRASEGFLGINSLMHQEKEYCSMRLFNCFGPDEGLDAVIPRFIYQAAKGEALTVDGSGEQRRDFLFISDMVERLGALTEVSTVPPVINVGSGHSYSINELVNLIGSISSLPVRRISRPARFEDIHEFLADISLLEDTIDVRPPLALRESLIATWAALVQLHGGVEDKP